MKQNILFSMCLLACLCLNVSVKADVLEPWLLTEVPETPAGYGRLVFALSGGGTPEGSITVCDENNNQYTLVAHSSGTSPNCYFMAYGTYQVVSQGQSAINSNWGSLSVGSTFTVTGDGYMSSSYTPDPRSIIATSHTDDNVPGSKAGYKIMKVYGEEVNGTCILVDANGEEYSVYNYTGHPGGAHYFYIKPGTYTVKTAGTNGTYVYLEINGTRTRISTSSSITIPNATLSSLAIVFV